MLWGSEEARDSHNPLDILSALCGCQSTTDYYEDSPDEPAARPNKPVQGDGFNPMLQGLSDRLRG